MNMMTTIDSYLNCLSIEDNIRLYDRWAVEYKQRYYSIQNIRDENKPKPHRQYPGFECNFRYLLWNILKENRLDPHGEWPYASQIVNSTKRADIHVINQNMELWFELGMYASDEQSKYSKDFEKLKAIVRSTKAENIGILIHIEVFKKRKVSRIFEEFNNERHTGIEIHFREFITGNRLTMCRLILSKEA